MTQRPHHRNDSCSSAGLHVSLSRTNMESKRTLTPTRHNSQQTRLARRRGLQLCGFLFKKEISKTEQTPNKDAPLSIITREYAREHSRRRNSHRGRPLPCQVFILRTFPYFPCSHRVPDEFVRSETTGQRGDARVKSSEKGIMGA